MRKLIGIIVFTAVLAVPLTAADVESPGPMSIEKWSIQWNRFKRVAFIDATFRNTSVKQISTLSVVLEFFDDRGRLVKKLQPWRKSYLSGRAKTRMKLRRRCPPFQMYQIRFTGRAKDDFQQLFEGKYWPDRPGDTPDMPEPVVYAEGSADVRVAGARTEYLKVRKGREALRISGSARNMGDRPAENVVVTITMLDNEEKIVWTKDIAVKPAKLEPGASAPFSIILKRIPHHAKVTYNADFDSIETIEEAAETIEEAATIEKFDVEAGPLLIKDCVIDPKTGLFTGTLTNNGAEIVSGVVVNISIEKAGATTTYKIKPGGDIKPGDSLSLIKTTMPEPESFGVNVGFQEK